MTCFDCESDRVLNVIVRCDNQCFIKYKNKEKRGYVPDDIGIGGGRNIDFYFCMDCGKIQTSYPIHEEYIQSILNSEDDDEQL